jgi:hypothetical protein
MTNQRTSLAGYGYPGLQSICIEFLEEKGQRCHLGEHAGREGQNTLKNPSSWRRRMDGGHPIPSRSLCTGLSENGVTRKEKTSSEAYQLKFRRWGICTVR